MHIPGIYDQRQFALARVQGSIADYLVEESLSCLKINLLVYLKQFNYYAKSQVATY